MREHDDDEEDRRNTLRLALAKCAANQDVYSEILDEIAEVGGCPCCILGAALDIMAVVTDDITVLERELLNLRARVEH